MKEVKKIEIDGATYAITPMDPVRAVKMLARLVKAYGGPIKTIVLSKMGGEAKKTEDISPLVLGQAIDDLIQAIDPDDLEKIINELIKPEFISYSTDGANYSKIVSINGHFSNYELMHLFKVVKSILEVNYSDFLGGLVG